jgi:hypothetical protein
MDFVSLFVLLVLLGPLAWLAWIGVAIAIGTLLVASIVAVPIGD